MTFKDIVNKGVEILKANQDTIFGISVTFGCALLAKKLGLPIGEIIGGRSYHPYWRASGPIYPFEIFNAPHGPVEAAIHQLGTSARTMSFDSEKVSAARSIVDVLTKSETVTDENKTYAISILGDIASTMDFGSNKQAINSLIMKITNN